MRTLTQNAQDALEQDKGTEPVNIVEIQWSPSGNRIAYADRDHEHIQGRILEISEVDSVITVDQGSTSTQFSIVLDDSDGNLKQILDTTDIYKRPVWLYQWFGDIPLDDKFLIFKGLIDTPITWDEGARTLSFNVLSEVESREVGFSADQGEFPQIPDTLVGRMFPIVFGLVQDLPAIRLVQSATGSGTKAPAVGSLLRGVTQEGVGIVSGADLIPAMSTGLEMQIIGLNRRAAVMLEQQSILQMAATRFDRAGETARANELRNQANVVAGNISQSFSTLEQNLNAQAIQRQQQRNELTSAEMLGPTTITVLGGEDFPQNQTIEIEIGSGGFFTGQFNGQKFTIQSRRHPGNEERAQEAFERSEGHTMQIFPAENFHYTMDTPEGPLVRKGLLLGQEALAPNRVPQVAQHFWADAGSEVKLAEDEAAFYLVAQGPVSVKAVKAYKDFGNSRVLTHVPRDLWEVIEQDYGDVTGVFIRVDKRLSSIEGQDWEDDLFVTVESPVGPNTVDIMEWLIENYSDLETDETTFDEVRTILDPLPSHFALFNHQPVLDLLREIAFQARCAVSVQDGVARLHFLPKKPDAEMSVSLDNISHKTLTVYTTPSEEIVTKLRAVWRQSYAEGAERQIILRNNIPKYGTHEQTIDWFIYNNPQLVYKAATFWIIRMSNAWRRVRFRGFLDLLPIETMDAIDLDLGSHMPTARAIVQQSGYDSNSHEVMLDCWLPVRSGSTTEFPFAWPFDAPGDYPPAGDEALAGSDFNVSGILPSGELPVEGQGGIIVGGANVAFQGPSDQGERHPRDVGFTPQPIVFPGTDFELDTSPRPRAPVGMEYLEYVQFPETLDLPQPITLSLEGTRIVDANDNSATLSSFFQTIDSERLVLRSDVEVNDGSNQAGFEFRFDSESGEFAAGKAFLADD
jgi:hypothetical protein